MRDKERPDSGSWFIHEPYPAFLYKPTVQESLGLRGILLQIRLDGP